MDIIIILILMAVIGLATGYVLKAKKSGKKCIGCPDGCSSSESGGGCSCCCGCNKEE